MLQQGRQKSNPGREFTIYDWRDELRFRAGKMKLASRAMSANFGAENIELSSIQFTPELLRCIPAEMACKFRVLPVSQTETQVRIAIADPTKLNAVDTLAQHLNREVYIYTADEGEVDAFIERIYGIDGRA